MLLPTDLPSANKLAPTSEQTKVIQEVVLPEVFKLNQAVMNKKQGDYAVFSRKVPEKRKWIHQTPDPYQSMCANQSTALYETGAVSRVCHSVYHVCHWKKESRKVVATLMILTLLLVFMKKKKNSKYMTEIIMIYR